MLLVRFLTGADKRCAWKQYSIVAAVIMRRSSCGSLAPPGLLLSSAAHGASVRRMNVLFIAADDRRTDLAATATTPRIRASQRTSRAVPSMPPPSRRLPRNSCSSSQSLRCRKNDVTGYPLHDCRRLRPRTFDLRPRRNTSWLSRCVALSEALWTVRQPTANHQWLTATLSNRFSAG